MSMRRSISLLGLCIATAAAGLVSPAAAQWVLPRTPDGHPDLQGNWTNRTQLTPFERRRGTGAVLTPEEVATLEGRAVDRIVTGAQRSDPNRPPPEAGVPIGGARNPGYNNVFYNRGDRVAVIDGEARSSVITNPPDGRKPPLTPEAQQRRREQREFSSQFEQYDNPENRPGPGRCLMFTSNPGPPMILDHSYNNNFTIVQTADYVMINTEMIHDTRIIPLREPDPLPQHVRPWFGDSWGRWEGNTLVVETTNINHSQVFRGIAPTDDLKVIERFTRVDEETILYEFTMDDPTTYTQPWGGEVPFTKFDKLLYEYSCHEGNYSLRNVLSGARYQERQAGGN